MPAASDTSPVLNLVIVGRLSLLREQFGEVWLPQACHEELRVDADLPGSGAIREALSEGWIQVRQVGAQPLVGQSRQLG